MKYRFKIAIRTCGQYTCVSYLLQVRLEWGRQSGAVDVLGQGGQEFTQLWVLRQVLLSEVAQWEGRQHWG